MSKADAPPAYGADSASNQGPASSKGQGSERALPDGWVKQFDTNYNQHFYVDTRCNPPRSTWVHPDDEQGGYSAPSDAPPGQQSSRYGSGSGPGPQASYQPQQQGYMPQQQGYMPQQQGYMPQQQGYMAQGYYPQQQYAQPVMVQQPYSSGMGMGSGRFGGLSSGLGGLGGGRLGGGLGTGLLGGGAGLLGGFALAEGMEHMEHNAYDQGYMQGDMNGDMGGGDMGGGDMGGGDMGGGDMGGGF